MPDWQCCSGPRVVRSLALNLIPSKSDQSLLPNWAICTWVVTNKKLSVAFSYFHLTITHISKRRSWRHMSRWFISVCLDPFCLPTMLRNSGNRGSLRVCCWIFLARATLGKIFHLKVGAECLLLPAPWSKCVCQLRPHFWCLEDMNKFLVISCVTSCAFGKIKGRQKFEFS